MKRLIVLNGQTTLIGEFQGLDESNFYLFKDLFMIVLGPQGAALVPYPIGRSENSTIKINSKQISVIVEEDEIDQQLKNEYTRMVTGIEVVDNVDPFNDFKLKKDSSNFNELTKIKQESSKFKESVEKEDGNGKVMDFMKHLEKKKDNNNK